MATTLQQVLQLFQDDETPQSIQEMARQLKIDKGMLEDMLAFWVRKGKLREVSSPTTCTTCGTKGECAYIVKTPRRYELVRKTQDDFSVPMASPPCHE